jgi:hypothetical protein
MQLNDQVLVLEPGECLRLDDGTRICVQRVRDGQVRLKIMDAEEARREQRGSWWNWLLPRALRSV